MFLCIFKDMNPLILYRIQSSTIIYLYGFSLLLDNDLIPNYFFNAIIAIHKHGYWIERSWKDWQFCTYTRMHNTHIHTLLSFSTHQFTSFTAVIQTHTATSEHTPINCSTQMLRWCGDVCTEKILDTSDKNLFW